MLIELAVSLSPPSSLRLAAATFAGGRACSAPMPCPLPAAHDDAHTITQLPYFNYNCGAFMQVCPIHPIFYAPLPIVLLAAAAVVMCLRVRRR